ncbi:hypothetical protein ACFWAY_29440 [Rhodococcus sp. NPDC059968]|uniref:hypothetical protein n=1 Tax=Rhodococcus sp. NPDC059968 TaxID=3347017 RepID=UPI00366BB8A0
MAILHLLPSELMMCWYDTSGPSWTWFGGSTYVVFAAIGLPSESVVRNSSSHIALPGK